MAGFSQFQLWVVAMLASGLSPSQIAELRDATPDSAYQAIKHVCRKTGLKTHAEIIEWAKDNGLDDPSMLEVPARIVWDRKMNGFFKATT